MVNMQQFHIRESVVFENILPDEYYDVSNALSVSRTRMCLQQMLDDPPDIQQLISKCMEYNNEFNDILQFMTKNRQIQLKIQPIFHWYINDMSISSSCWLMESVLIKHTIAALLEHNGTDLLETDVKKASKIFDTAIKTREELLDILDLWKWKQLHYNILHKNWHLSKIYYLKTQQQLAMIDVGISKQTPAKTLFTVSQRAVKCAASAIKMWPVSVNVQILHLTEALRYLFSSNILWSREKYGQSIYRIQNWISKPIDAGPYKNIQEHFSNISFLLNERQKDNESIYFHKIEAGLPLIEAFELIHSNEDVPHPSSGETNVENETHATLSSQKSVE